MLFTISLTVRSRVHQEEHFIPPTCITNPIHLPIIPFPHHTSPFHPSTLPPSLPPLTPSHPSQRLPARPNPIPSHPIHILAKRCPIRSSAPISHSSREKTSLVSRNKGERAGASPLQAAGVGDRDASMQVQVCRKEGSVAKVRQSARRRSGNNAAIWLAANLRWSLVAVRELSMSMSMSTFTHCVSCCARCVRRGWMLADRARWDSTQLEERGEARPTPALSNNGCE